jgi:hypothetical protein
VVFGLTAEGYIAASNRIKPLELLARVEESHERSAMESRLGTRRLSPTL